MILKTCHAALLPKRPKDLLTVLAPAIGPVFQASMNRLLRRSISRVRSSGRLKKFWLVLVASDDIEPSDGRRLGVDVQIRVAIDELGGSTSCSLRLIDRVGPAARGENAALRHSDFVVAAVDLCP